MRTVLVSAYAVNPTKGSEDGMGWNYIMQAAVNNNVIAITRRNNRDGIESYISMHADAQSLYDRVCFMYFDWPQWMLFWKKGPMLSMIYYYMWQVSLVVWLKIKKVKCDIVHNLNFHNDWTPSFLWLLNRRFVWGPVGHHPRIPTTFLKVYGIRELVKDRLVWAMKWCFWNLDPLLRLTRSKADAVWCMHDAAAQRLKLRAKYMVHPSVAAQPVQVAQRANDTFTVLSIGRFVALKGFDVTIKAFATFYRALPPDEKYKVRLKIIGKGPQKALIERLLIEEDIAEVTDLIRWMPQEQLAAVYEQSAAFLFPSHEGAGMVVAEAMRYNMPVLCWDNIGPGTIVHPSSKLKVKYAGYDESVKTFARNLYHLWKDKNFYEHESQLAGTRFSEALDWQVRSGQLDKLYDEAMNDHK